MALVLPPYVKFLKRSTKVCCIFLGVCVCKSLSMESLLLSKIGLSLINCKINLKCIIVNPSGFLGNFGIVQYPFYVMANKDYNGNFYFGNNQITNYKFSKIRYSQINFVSDKYFENNFQCISGKINSKTLKLDLSITDCFEKHTIICRKVLFMKPNCLLSFEEDKNNSFYEIIFDSLERKELKLAVEYKKAELSDILQRLNMSAAYQSIFKTLWYSSLPCFDIRKITGFNNGASALLQYCEWKGMPISCSAIFTTFPTDQGMCCSFNMKAADEIYVNSAYRDMLQSMQKADKEGSFLSSSVPKYYVDNKEPKTTPGKKKGLILMLDAHSDWLAPGSMDGVLEGFTAFIDSSGNFPLIHQAGLSIKAGFNNIITLTSSIVKADENMQSLDKKSRVCFFSNENENLKLHQEYTYLNCMFECTLNYTKLMVALKYNKTCQPWFFPTSSESVSICDPWQSYDFFQIMTNEIPDDFCAICLPDCNVTIYNPTITVEPFIKCDANNIGVSQFCSIDLQHPLPLQMRLASQIQNYFSNTSSGKFANMPD